MQAVEILSKRTTSWRVLDTIAVGGGIIAAVWTWCHLRSQRRGHAARPPGPKGYPLIGNLFDLPKEKEWLTYADWGKKYGASDLQPIGPISYAESRSVRIVILNTYEVACELLEKRSIMYSDRMHSLIMDEMGWGWITSHQPYGDQLRKHRLLLHRFFQPAALKNYHEVQTQNARQLAKHILENPKDFLKHIRSASGALILSLVYGYDADWEDDPYIALADEALQWLSKGQEPGAYLIDSLPWIRNLPDWFPGMNWRRDAKTAFEFSQGMLKDPVNLVKQRLRNGEALSCMVSEALESKSDGSGQYQQEDESVIAGSLATAYAGGSDTTVSLVQSAILAFLLHPDVLARAQRELDSVTGGVRLPTFDDRVSMPFMECVVREALRWNPVTPLGVPRSTATDDIYNGYHIPANCTVVVNQWAILHDENMYPDPLNFKPERWLDSSGRLMLYALAPMHPNKAAFGFGRRVCPGRYFAENTAFIQIATIASMFDIRNTTDKSGKAIIPPVSYNSGILSHPDPFECEIVARSPVCSSLILQALNMK